ncbi:MAG: CreA family protein [Deferrisomatales bacterium]|nr:CreA family protein [Deferrisomatales bacterium]
MKFFGDSRVSSWEAADRQSRGVAMARTLSVIIFSLLVLVCLPRSSFSEIVGHVDTKWNALSPDDSIVVEAFDDPDIEGVACHISRAKKGGWKRTVGLGEDPSEASIACRQIGPIKIQGTLEDGEEVFSARASAVFKKVHVVRFLDKKRNTLVYLVYSDKLIDGSPKNSLSTVPMMPWGK